MQCGDKHLPRGPLGLPRKKLLPSTPQHTTVTGLGMDDAAEQKRERRRRQRQRVAGCFRKFVTFLFSHIGLAALVVGYSILGGFLFQWLEAGSEWQEKFRVQVVKEDVIEQLRSTATHLKEGQINTTYFENKVRGVLLYYQKQIILAVKEKGWDGNDDMSTSSVQWSFAGALLYAVTVITTIGYGHVAPKTSEGRLVTIVYALIGIPLTFLYLSNIGNFLADAFRLFYKKVCCDVFCCKKCERKRKRERLKMRRRRELAAQRNTLLGGLNDSYLGTYGAADIEADYPGRETPLGLPGGNENLALEMDSAFHDDQGSLSQLTNRSGSQARLLQHDDVDHSQGSLSQLMDDSIRETAILEDDTVSAVSDQGAKLKTPETPTSELRMSKGVLDKLDEAKETAILDSDDETLEEHKRAKSTGDLESMCDESDDDGGRGARDHKSLPMRGRSLKATRANKELSKKEQRTLSKERAKEEKLLKKRVKKEKSLERKRLKEEKKAEKKAEKEKKKDKRGDKESANHEEELNTNASSSTSAENKSSEQPGSSNAEETEVKSSLPNMNSSKLLRKSMSTKDRSKLKKDPDFRRAMSQRARSVGPETVIGSQSPGIKNRSFHASEESFVTAQGESMSQLNRTPDTGTLHEEDEPDDAMTEDDDNHSELIIKNHTMGNSTALHDMAIDMDCPYDQLELGEYTDLKGNALNFVDDPFDYEDEDEDAKVTVPVSICLILIAGYIFAGSVLFTLWEEWDYLTGSYFCFITLSTIGFGDIVPGTDMKEWASHEKLILCVLWLAFGLSLLAMCFNLMQEEVKEKIKRIGRKIGLLRNDGEG